VPEFCRHNRFAANCPICSRERDQAAAPRRAPGVTRTGGPVTRKRSAGAGGRAGSHGGGLRVRQLAREADDGFRSPLLPGVKASGDAQRLAEELAFASARLDALARAPFGLYAEVARLAADGAEPAGGAPASGDAAADGGALAPGGAPSDGREEATWLAFLIAYVGPLDGEDPFAGVRAARVPWAGGELPALDDVPLGPRSAHDPSRGATTLAAYRTWAQRAGSQTAGFAGEAAWAPERRFARVFERLALPGLHRDARFDLLETLGRLGVHDLEAGSLALGGADEVTVAAKRVFAIGDTLLLERRAADLAAACEVPLAALDLALWNWSRPAAGGRTTLGFGGEPDAAAFARAGDALGL
jgi:hypothetical protein